MNTTFEMEKWVWTEADFKEMGWHDSRIYALRFLPEKHEFVLDIDYILQWNHPLPGKNTFSFWVSPATLVFENVYDLGFDIGSSTGNLEIDSILRTNEKIPRNSEFIDKDQEWEWIISCQEGEIKFNSVGYKMYVRTAPLFGGQEVPVDVRGESNFFRGRTDLK